MTDPRTQAQAQTPQPAADRQARTRGQQQPQESNAAGQADGQQQQRPGQADGQQRQAEKAAMPTAAEVQQYVVGAAGGLALLLQFGPRIAALAKEIMDAWRGSNSPTYQQGGEDR